MVKITLGIEKYKYPKNNPNIEYANTVFSPNNPFVTIPINPWRPANIIIKKPITTPGKASGKVSIDKRVQTKLNTIVKNAHDELRYNSIHNAVLAHATSILY